MLIICRHQLIKIPWLHPQYYYPASLGEVLNDRYQLATKIGYGSSSTVWLARDLHHCRWLKERYVAIKINAKDHHSRKGAPESEFAILRYISRSSRHEGWHFVRKLIDSFLINNVSGNHICLVFEPLWLYCRRFVDGVMPSDVLNVILRIVLEGLDYLHWECQVIHTDLKPHNVMVKLEDPGILERDVRDEYDHPLPRKILDGRTIYLSRNNYGQLFKPTGIIQFTDFGLSVRGNIPHSGCIQAELYRTPEVVRDAGYTYSADIWSLGVMVKNMRI
ncbi:hypothetical protein jhhlp_004650 [Lomentospora prolificans]|uniref:non-specific serine/threonine protein kinase n=1 Tax=Lomentospora prolificans TaxID=41688 RepID=A0A2N3NC65_9PEZI|nr:hypothetical protein jhhlp_004650 [Lomentospora prolificans]